MTVRQYILHGHEPVPAKDLLEWAQWYETADRQVADDYAGEWHEKPCRVSTVFLGLDHDFTGRGPPVLFETMIFGGTMNGEMARYSTWGEAEIGHKRMLERAKAAIAEGAT